MMKEWISKNKKLSITYEAVILCMHFDGFKQVTGFFASSEENVGKADLMGHTHQIADVNLLVN